MDRAYIAGLFDGEGSVCITRSGELVVELSNTHKEIIDRLYDQYGGCAIRTRRPTKPNHRVQWTWAVKANKAAGFLQDVRPWLVIKADQADLGLEFQKNKRWCRAGRGRPIPDDEKTWRLEQARQMRELNARGIRYGGGLWGV